MAEADAQINVTLVLGSLPGGSVRGEDKVLSKRAGVFVVVGSTRVFVVSGKEVIIDHK